MSESQQESGNYRSQTFSTRKSRDQLESFAKNRGFDEVSPYIRNLIRQDMQEQIAEGKLELVTTHE